MNKKRDTCIKMLFTLVFLFMAIRFVFPQHQKDELIRQKEYLEKSIEYANLLIDDARQLKQSTLNDLLLLQSKIEYREDLIQNLNREQTLLTDTILMNLLQIDQLSILLDKLKDEYAQMVRSAYENQKTSQRMLYVFASESFNQAYRRLNFYRHYSENRNLQIDRIHKTEADYILKIEHLEKKLDRNQQLLSNLNLEYTTLDEEIQLKSEILTSLNDRVKKLIAEQQQNMIASLELEKRIEEAVFESTDNSRQQGGNGEDLIILTPEENLMSSNFMDNRGKLPWPLERGIISSYFGEHNHPELDRVKIKNNGINFLTQEGATARAVFDGEVTRILSVPNFNTVVIVRHGNFLTVYSNLSTVFVEPGTKIKTKQEIGTIFTNKEQVKTELHFEIWEGKNLLDPSEWITSGRNRDLLRGNNP